MHYQATAASDRGLQRSENEDSYLCRPDIGLFAVADGMGGHAAGDVASRIAVDTLEHEFHDVDRDVPPRILARALRRAVQRANRAIIEQGLRETEQAGMGSTLTAFALGTGARAWMIAHVGDSRAYRLRRGRFLQLTTDHTWVQQQVAAGRLTPEQARAHPFSSVLTRALGVQGDVDVDLLRGDCEPGDLFLLCSDGLTGMIDDEELAAALGQDVPLERTAAGLIEAANARGGLDNITVVLIRAAA